ncbi:hypothetical protein SteCoe_25048 [Stentor coeruleus]|uniref:Uncharacterized protein n=1 Tax=Stentor coeruleus TaxID=5963 RepID=A0A1R2BGI3_9CILI|nr:hypothetical protein SteCoe_25048 [Stentor coeruleus]
MLLLTLEEELKIMTEIKTIEPENLAIPLSAKNSQLSAKNSQLSANNKDKTIKKRMKVELEVVLRPLTKKKGEEILDNIGKVAENIKKSIFSDGVKKELISYAKENRNIKRASIIEQGMSRIIKKRLKANKSFVESESSESVDKTCSDGEDVRKFVISDAKSRNMMNLKYEMNINTSIMSRKSIRSVGSDHDQIRENLENITSLSEDYRYVENDKDVNSELFLMNWCSTRNMKKFIFSSQVNFKDLDAEAFLSLKSDKQENFEDEVDIKNLESRMLKNRFYVLKNIANTNINPMHQEPYTLAMINQDEFNPTEQKNFEVEKIRKYLKKMHFKKNRKGRYVRQTTFRTFTNLDTFMSYK